MFKEDFYGTKSVLQNLSNENFRINFLINDTYMYIALCEILKYMFYVGEKYADVVK